MASSKVTMTMTNHDVGFGGKVNDDVFFFIGISFYLEFCGIGQQRKQMTAHLMVELC